MKIIKMNSVDEIANEVSRIIMDQVNSKPDSVLGFATGASPVPTYNRLIEEYEKGNVSFKNITTFNLDEYCTLAHDDPNSYYYFMKDRLFGKTDVDFEKVNFLSGVSAFHEETCREYRKKIEASGGIDIQLLGVGRNGHIGFNEPSDEFTDGPFMVKLTQSTIDANSKYFTDSKMPEYALTMGIGDIMRAKKILLIATGTEKANAVFAMVKGEVTPKCPASILQKHSDVTIFVDDESASLI